MKKSIVLIILLLSFTFSIKSQQANNLEIACEKLSLTSPSIEVQISKLKNDFPKVNLDESFVVKKLIVKPDSTKKKVELEVDDKEFMIYDRLSKKIYKYNQRMQKFSPMITSSFHKLLEWMKNDRFANVDCIYLVQLNPDERIDYILYKKEEITFFINNESDGFDSLEKLLEYDFGSTTNFIETYQKRLEHISKRRSINK